MTAAAQLTELRRRHERRRADALRCDEEMAAPSAPFERVRDMRVARKPTVIECQKERPAIAPLVEPVERAARSAPGDPADGVEMPIEVGARELVAGRAGARKAACVEAAVVDDVMILERQGLHTASVSLSTSIADSCSARADPTP